MRSKFWALLLSIMMVVTMMPASAFADTLPTGDQNGTTVEQTQPSDTSDQSVDENDQSADDKTTGSDESARSSDTSNTNDSSGDNVPVVLSDDDESSTDVSSTATTDAYFYVVKPGGKQTALDDGSWKYVGMGKIDSTGLNIALNNYSLDVQDRAIIFPDDDSIKQAIANLYGVDPAKADIGYTPYKISYPYGWVDALRNPHDSNKRCYHVDMAVSITTVDKVSASYYLWDADAEGYNLVENTTIVKGKTTSPNGSYPANKTIEGSPVPYVFDGWYTNSSRTGDKVEFPYTANEAVSFYAKYVPSFTVTAENYEGIYDGNSHGTTVTVSPNINATITYSEDGGETWSSNEPTIKNVGTKNCIVKQIS